MVTTYAPCAAIEEPHMDAAEDLRRAERAAREHGRIAQAQTYRVLRELLTEAGNEWAGRRGAA